MRMSNVMLGLPLACASLVLAFFGLAAAQEKGQDKSDRTEKVTVQCRLKTDALASPTSSRFLCLSGKAASILPLDLHWDIPMTEAKQKKDFDDLIKKLEEKRINGVEFECQGEWLKVDLNAAPRTPSKPLRVTSVPQLTETGKKRINESGR